MVDPTPYPLFFEPVFRDYIWGGRNLETLLGRTIPEGVVAESWEISGHPSSSTRVENGPLAGLTARAVVVLDEDDNVLHSELVSEIGQEPDYEAALAAL